MSMYEKTKGKDIKVMSEELKQTILTTSGNLARIVGSTLGPGGRPILIERENKSPLVTKDGVTVVKNIGLTNNIESCVIEAIKEVAQKTAKEAGDGTTSSVILSDAIIKHGFNFMTSANNPQRVCRELNQCFSKVITPFLAKKSKKVSSNEKALKQVALISSNGDKEVSELVVEVVGLAGENGYINLVDGQGKDLTYENSNGYIVTQGLKDIGPIGINFANKSNTYIGSNGIVVAYNGTLSDMNFYSFLYNTITTDARFIGKSVILIAHDFSDDFLKKILECSKLGIPFLPIKSIRTSLPNSKTYFLQDLCVYTGAKIVEPFHLDVADGKMLFNESFFGKFNSVKATMHETLIQNDPDTVTVNNRIEELKILLSQAFSDLDKNHIQAMISKLTGCIITVKVGGMSDLEILERKDRIQDAIEAVNSAIEQGVVLGGASTYIAIVRELKNHKDRKESWSILESALLEPIKCLMFNGGSKRNCDDVIVHLTTNEKDVLDINSDEFVDGFKVGIIEPTKVISCALSNAISVATILTTLGGVISSPTDINLEQQKELSKMMMSSMMNQGV